MLRRAAPRPPRLTWNAGAGRPLRQSRGGSAGPPLAAARGAEGAPHPGDITELSHRRGSALGTAGSARACSSRPGRGSRGLGSAAARGLRGRELPVCRHRCASGRRRFKMAIRVSRRLLTPSSLAHRVHTDAGEAALAVACLHQSGWIFFPLDWQYFLALL